jgi:hypothetical protein
VDAPIGQVLVSIPDTGRHGTARLDAASALAQALGCHSCSTDPLTGYRQRAADGSYYLTIRGPRPTVRWLGQALPAMLGRIDMAATAATRLYAAWLRDRCPPHDHMPAERSILRAAWRRAYIRAYASTLAARIARPAAPPVQLDHAGDPYGMHRADVAARHDATRAPLADYTPPPARHVETTSLRIIGGAALPSDPRATRGRSARAIARGA